MSFKIGKKRKFQQRIVSYHTDLYRVAYSWSHDHELAKEISQETLAKALTHADKLKDINSMKSWLFRILRNCWCDNYKNTRNTENISDYELTTEDISEDIIFQHQIKRRVKIAINKLSEEQRQVVTLVDLTSMSYIEAAESLEIPIGTLMSRLHRARKHLQTYLHDLDIHNTTMHPHIRGVK